MSKSDSGHFNGTRGRLVSQGILVETEHGEKNPLKVFESKVSAVKDTFSLEGKLSAQSIRENASTFSEKSIFVYATALQDRGYTVQVKNSTRSKSGAQIITVSNTNKDRNISQIQVSPGGGRHGDSPYVKISTTNNGKFKIVDGTADNYKSNAKETAEIIFRRKKQ